MNGGIVRAGQRILNGTVHGAEDVGRRATGVVDEIARSAVRPGSAARTAESAADDLLGLGDPPARTAPDALAVTAPRPATSPEGALSEGPAGGSVTLRGGSARPGQARRGGQPADDAVPSTVADDGVHGNSPSGPHMRFMPPRDIPNPNPRYLGRTTTIEGRELEVRAFDSGRIEIGDRVYEGRLDRDLQELYFRGPDNAQWSARLTGVDNNFTIGRAPQSHYAGVIDNEAVALRGSTVSTRDGRVIGFSSSLEHGRVTTRINPDDPFAREIGELMSVRGRELRPHPTLAGVMVTPTVDGVTYAIYAGGRAARFEMLGGRQAFTDGAGITRLAERTADGVERFQAVRPGIQVLGDDAILVDGRLERLTATDTPGMLIGRGRHDRSLSVYHRADDGALSPANISEARLMSATTGDAMFIVAPGANNRAVVHDAYHPVNERDFLIRDARGAVRYARRNADSSYTIMPGATLPDRSFVLDGGHYHREMFGVLDDGREVSVGRRMEGTGQGWRIADPRGRTLGAMRMTPGDDGPMVIRHAGTREPTAIIDNGVVYRPELVPDGEATLARRVSGHLRNGEANYPAEQRELLLSLQRTFGDDEAALFGALNGTDPAAVARLESAIGPQPRDTLWRAFGLVSEQRDPLVYATRVGALTDTNPAPTRLYAGGQQVGVVDYPNDIGIYRNQGGRLMPATDDEIRAQFGRMVPELATPVRNSEWEEMARPTRVSIDGTATARERTITVERAGLPPQRIRVSVTERLGPHTPTPEQIAELLGYMPNIAVRSLDTINFGTSRLASFQHSSRTMTIGNSTGWTPFEVDRMRILGHELLGHGLEMNDPLVHRALLLARRLDGIGATRPYGGVNRWESFAVGMQDVIAHAEDAARRSPHTARLFWHLLRDQSPTMTPEARRALLGGTSLALLFGIMPQLRPMDAEQPL